jgi:hypothetical protein
MGLYSLDRFALFEFNYLATPASLELAIVKATANARPMVKAIRAFAVLYTLL